MKSFIPGILLGILFTLLILVGGRSPCLLLGVCRGSQRSAAVTAGKRIREDGVTRLGTARSAGDGEPLPANRGKPDRRREIYLNECAGCHGTPAKPDKYPGVLFPPAPHLPTTGTEYTEAQVF